MTMSAVDLQSTPEDTATSRPALEPEQRLAWDETVGPVPIARGWDSEPLVLDWFGTGQSDLLVSFGGGPHGRRAYIFRASSASHNDEAVYDEGTAVEALDGLRGLCALPNGRDSRFDLIGLAPSGLVHLPNRGRSDAPHFEDRLSLGFGPDLGIGPCRIVQLFAVDWDGDRNVDVLVGIDDLTDYWPDSPSLPVSQQRGFNQRGGHPSYDHAGLWRGGAPRGRLFWLKNTGTPGAPAFSLQPEIIGDTHPLDLGLHPAPLAVAWERPRSLELLVTDRRGLVHLHRNFGDQRPPVLMEPRTLTCGGAQFLLPHERTVLIAADLDGDHCDELIHGTCDGRVFAIHSGATRREVKNPRVLRERTRRLWLGGHAVVAAGDLHQSGGLDLIVGDVTGRLHLLRDHFEHGEHRYRDSVALDSGGAPFQIDPGPDGMIDGPVGPKLGYACPSLVDWTGNSRVDLLVGSVEGEILFLRNDGAANDPRFGAPARLRCQGVPVITPPRVRPAAADWTGDGQADLIALDLQGFLCVYPRLRAGEVSQPVPMHDRLGRLIRLDGGFGLSGGCALWAGPWCGSGRPDILVGLSRANRHVVPAVTGISYDRFDAIPTVLLLENRGEGVLVPRPMHWADGSPLILGHEGCSPSGVLDGTGESLSLLVGLDDGQVILLRRDELAW